MRFSCKPATSVLAFFCAAGMANADFWKDAAAPYQGVTIRGVTESTPPSQYIREVLAPEFEELTGIRVEIETTSWGQMYDKAIKDMEAGTGIYDVVYIEQDIVYAYLSRGFLVNITDSLANNDALKSPTWNENQFTTFANYFRGADDGDLYGVPMEAFIKPYLYRTDLFGDADIQAEFREKTGRDLVPATSHAEYAEIAEFFTNYGKENGIDLWGTTAQAHTGHVASWYEFFESVAPTFGVYSWGIKPDGNYAASVANGGEMNSPEAKEAMAWWLAMRDLAPPEAPSSTWTEVGTTFAAGRAAQGLVYGENAGWIAVDEDKSLVVGNVGVALPPLAEGVLEEAESGNGYIGYFDGGAFGIPSTSRQQEAALLFLQYIGQEDVQPDWAVAAPRVTHKATYAAPQVQELNEELGGYYDLMKDKGYLFSGAPEYPFHAQVREATAPTFYQILTGDLSIDEGLDLMAEKAEEELKNLGYRS